MVLSCSELCRFFLPVFKYSRRSSFSPWGYRSVQVSLVTWPALYNFPATKVCFYITNIMNKEVSYINIKSSADLRNKYSEVSELTKVSGEPIYITLNGKGDGAFMTSRPLKRGKNFC